ncbi:hypothetical protein [Jannaschia sp. CCS1]|uniref:hypothetical protein n=1 Tax=Jannaschia sp. (strain CCS1) TaxID=290400 RepID=UPI000053B00C|nr:hypothetical protein [Jannaschia sp. CCS1]ABD56897.1 hypothetical protein Jann_3980 [Jannaschia sp. CCS1]
MIRGLAWTVGMALTSTTVLAQDASLPVAGVLSQHYVQAFPATGARLAMFEMGEAFRPELQAHDNAGVLNHQGQPDTLQDTDVLVTLVPTWDGAVDLFSGVFLEDVAFEISRTVEDQPTAHVVSSEVNLGHGVELLTLTFVATVNGEPQDPRCMARAVIDYIYRGQQEAVFDSPACSRVLN